MSQRRTLPFIVAVETDPLRYHGEHPLRPAPLAPPEAEQLLAHLSADLAKVFPNVSRHRLCLVGALYDQAQVLRPDWPLFSAMAEVARRRWKRERAEGGLLSIGAADGHLPRETLIPDRDLPPGVLQLLPLQLHGDTQALDAVEDQMERRFMEEGQLSPLSARALENAFRIGVAHARFLTLTDLRAMLKLQLEHLDFGALWTLLDAALEGDPPVDVPGPAGQAFRWSAGRVEARFETFDHWASQGAGRDLPAEALTRGYVDWSRGYRQVLVTLGAHAVPVTQHLPGAREPLEGDWFEERAGPAPAGAPGITEHDGAELGTLAVTVVRDGILHHLYPLGPEGLNAIHDHVTALGVAAGGISFPGRVCIDPEGRRLSADCETPAPP